MIDSTNITARNVPYNEGVSLFLKYSSNRRLIAFFLLPWSTHREDKLRYELGKLAKENTKIFEDHNSTLLPVKETKVEPISKSSKQEIKVKFTAEELEVSKEKHFPDELKELYRLRGHLHGGLHKCYSDEERYTLAKQIIDTQNKIEKFYAKDSTSEDQKLIKPVLTLEDHKKRQNARIYLARIKKELKTCKDLERIKILQERVNERQKILDSYGGPARKGKSN